MLARLIILFACSLFLFTVGVGTIHAANLGVNPVRVTLSESQKTGAITVLNKSTEPVSIQLEVLSWSQEEGKDVLTPTREILATPPIFTIPAGASQLIRIGLRRVPEMQLEQTYRIILQELPAPPSPEFNGTRMMMRISLPVFVLPKLATKPVLLWKAIRTLDGGLKISLTNNGNAHIQIADFSLSQPGSSQPWQTQKTSEYILPGQSRDWILPAILQNPAPAVGANIQIFAQTDAGQVEAEVMITP